jgi:hypothetical protein
MNPLANDLDTVGHYHAHFTQALPAAAERCRQYARGAYLASPSYDTSRSIGTHSDPTAQRAHTATRDETVKDQRELDRRMKNILADLDWIDRFVARYQAPRPGTATEGDQATCASCARIGVTSFATVMAPRNPAIPNLPLCRRCWEYAQDVGSWPARADLERAERTGRLYRRNASTAGA